VAKKSARNAPVGVGLPPGLGEGDGEGDGDVIGDGEGDGEGELIGDGEGDGELIGEGDGELIGEGAGEGEGDAIGEGDGDGEDEGDGDVNGDGEGQEPVGPSSTTSGGGTAHPVTTRARTRTRCTSKDADRIILAPALPTRASRQRHDARTNRHSHTHAVWGRVRTPEDDTGRRARVSRRLAWLLKEQAICRQIRRLNSSDFRPRCDGRRTGKRHCGLLALLCCRCERSRRSQRGVCSR
jgi:hypothetical protein